VGPRIILDVSEKREISLSLTRIGKLVEWSVSLPKSPEWIIMNNKLEKMWKEVVVA
jgi:hypothetical protein